MILSFAVLIVTAGCSKTGYSKQGQQTSRVYSREAGENAKISKSDVKKLYKAYVNTIKHWTYDMAAYEYTDYATPVARFKSGRGICWDYALYFYKMARKSGVKNVHFVVSNEMRHAWNELWVNNHVYTIDATWADNEPSADIKDYFLVPAQNDKSHYAADICVVDNTMHENDITTLYAGNFKADARRQKNTERRPIVKLVTVAGKNGE